MSIQKSSRHTKNAIMLLAILVFAILPSATASAQTYTVIGSFSSLTDPLSALVQDRDGSLIGTTEFGGSVSQGIVYDVALDGTITTLYTFDDINGGIPDSEGIILGTNGSYYGSTYMDGTANKGSVYQMSRAGAVRFLYSFPNATFGGPDGAFIYGFDGNLYGTNYSGGAYNGGGVYKVTPSGTANTIFSFSPGQGAYPEGALVLGSDGNFYGTTTEQSTNLGKLLFQGTIYKITPGGAISYLKKFGHLQQPTTGLALAPDGNFYGVMAFSTAVDGLIFRITPQGQYTVMHTFSGGVDGAGPSSALIVGSDGNLYGTTTKGGANGYGTVYQLTTAGNLTTVYDFQFTQTLTNNALMQHTNGLFYGGLSSIEPDGDSAIFSLDIGLPPFVKLVKPFGTVGSTIQILGQGFTGTTSVSFNGVPATTFTAVSDTFMAAVVPANATTGPVLIATPTGTLTGHFVKLSANRMPE
jgi:uncharacterized repeat protein (TIGR03803 family)